ncbi:MAG: hypothetical protein ACK4PK_06025 [Alphaproteobacteria bacterium]
MTAEPPREDKKPAAPFNRAADNFIKGPEDVARAIAALRARNPAHKTAAEKTQDEKETHFQTYSRVLAPFVDILRALPSKDGLEFFSRTDMDTRENTLRLWLFYARPGRNPFMNGGVPDTHGVSVPTKDPQRKQALTALALGARPVFEITVTPQPDGTSRIETHIYSERYARHNGTIPQGVLPRGEFIEQSETLSRQTHAALKKHHRPAA